MKKLAILTAVLVIIPIAAMARMSTLSDNAMGVVSGQTGITLSWESQITDSYIAIHDDDGFGTTKGGYNNPGSTTLDNFIITGTTAGSNMVITGLTIDAGNSGGNARVQVGLPTIQGLVQAGAVRIGTNDALGGSLGRVTVGDINVAKTDLVIYTH